MDKSERDLRALRQQLARAEIEITKLSARNTELERDAAESVRLRIGVAEASARVISLEKKCDGQNQKSVVSGGLL